MLQISSHAPPMTDAKMDRYQELIFSSPAGAVRDCAYKLWACVRRWRLDAKLHCHIVLFQDEVTMIDNTEESGFVFDCDAVTRAEQLCDTVPQGELRNALHHLLWFCKEFALGREPITTDRL